jgi:hypothetical protein
MVSQRVYCHEWRRQRLVQIQEKVTHVSGYNDDRWQKASPARSNEVAQVTNEPNDDKGDAETLPRFQREIFVQLWCVDNNPT